MPFAQPFGMASFTIRRSSPCGPCGQSVIVGGSRNSAQERSFRNGQSYSYYNVYHQWNYQRVHRNGNCYGNGKTECDNRWQFTDDLCRRKCNFDSFGCY